MSAEFHTTCREARAALRSAYVLIRCEVPDVDYHPMLDVMEEHHVGLIDKLERALTLLEAIDVEDVRVEVLRRAARLMPKDALEPQSRKVFTLIDGGGAA